MILYEHPLTERIRVLLRLEALFNRVTLSSAKDDDIDHHVALFTLFEILDIVSRIDIKSDLIRELERKKKTLESLYGNTEIDEETLNQTISNIQTISSNMLIMHGKTGEYLRENEWLMAIKNRIYTPGGTFGFDLPSYHYWLNMDSTLRRENIDKWLKPLLPIQAGVSTVLRLLRSSGKVTNEVAVLGVLHKTGWGSSAVHLLQIEIIDNFPCTPLISANKYALNIRFMLFNQEEKPLPCEEKINFTLTRCSY